MSESEAEEIAFSPSSLKLREHVLVRFADDPELQHHWVVTGKDDKAMFWVTPDRDIKLAVDVEDGGASGILELHKYNGSRLPTGTNAGETYRDKDTETGKFTSGEIDELVRLTSLQPKLVRVVAPIGAPPVALTHRVRGKRTVTPDSSPDHSWVVVAVNDSFPVGTILDKMSPGSWQPTEGDFALYRVGVAGIPVQRVFASEASVFAANLADKLLVTPRAGSKGNGHAGIADGGLDDYVVPGGPLDGGTYAKDPEDIRTLWVQVDTYTKLRHKDWRDVCEESVQHTFKDDPGKVSPIALHSAFRMLRHGGSPDLWFAVLCRKIGLMDNDRNFHEARNIVAAIQAFGCIDQFNIGGSVGIEMLFRRLASICEALKRGADRADWSLSKTIEALEDPVGLLSSERRAEVSRSAKDELDTAALRQRLAGPAKAEDNVDFTTGMPSKGAGKTKDKAKKGGGRGGLGDAGGGAAR